MAIAAVLSPLLILFGLKYGTIETLRSRLIQDPRNREIRPIVSRSFTHEWLEGIRARNDVAFVIPTTRQISANVDVQLKTEQVRRKAKKTIDIIPTAEGDRIILENGAPIPQTGQCVLTARAAEELQAAIGNTVICEAKRLKGNRYETGPFELEVAGVLTARASSLMAIYVPLEVLEAVERFKDGMAVFEYGWPGSTPRAYPVFNGLTIILPKELNKIEEITLINNTGFTQIQKVTSDDVFERAGYRVPPGNTVYLLTTKRKPAGQESVEAVKHRLRGKGAMVVPWVKDLSAALVQRSGETIANLTLRAFTLPPNRARGLGILPDVQWDDTSSETVNWRKVILPRNVASVEGPVQLCLTRGNQSLLFPVEVVSHKAPGMDALIPARLAGILNLFLHRSIGYESNSDEFVLFRRGYAGFRLYAATIDDVDRLRRYFEDIGIPVHTEAGRIRDVTELNNYLTLIFWLIAAVGIAGGIAVLIASLYASVERKRRELSILRLLGLSRHVLFRFPIYQGVCITAAGSGIAFVFFSGLAMVINVLFQEHLQVKESLCHLSPWHYVTTLGATIAIAVIASTLAAWRTTQIDPAEALRDE